MKALASLIRFQLTSKLTVLCISVVWDDSFKGTFRWDMKASEHVAAGGMYTKTIKTKPSWFSFSFLRQNITTCFESPR